MFIDSNGLSGLNNSLKVDNAEKKEDYEKQVEELSKEFEAVLTSTLLKESLKSSAAIGDDNSDKDQGSEQFREMVYDQFAYHIGKQGMLGIAKEIQQSLMDKINNNGGNI